MIADLTGPARNCMGPVSKYELVTGPFTLSLMLIDKPAIKVTLLGFWSYLRVLLACLWYQCLLHAIQMPPDADRSNVASTGWIYTRAPEFGAMLRLTPKRTPTLDGLSTIRWANAPSSTHNRPRLRIERQGINWIPKRPHFIFAYPYEIFFYKFFRLLPV